MRNMAKWINPDLELKVSKEDGEEEVQETEGEAEAEVEEAEADVESTEEESVAEAEETEAEVESDPEIVEAAPEAVEAAELIVPGIPEVPVSEEILFEAEAVAEEEAEESAEIREGMDEAKEGLEVVEEDTASVENFEKILKHGLAKGKFSPQLIAAASHAANHLAKRYGVEAEAGVSIESFKEVSLKEQYTASLEAFEGLKKALKAAGSRITKFLKDAFDPKYLERAKVENMRADKLASELTKKKGDKNKYSSGKLPAYFTAGEKDFVKKITADAKVFGEVIGRGLKANRTYFNSAAKLLNEIGSGKGDVSGKVKAFDNLAMPVKGYPASAFDAVLVGGMYLKRDEACPITAEKLAGRVNPNEVTNADLVQLIKMAKIYSAMPAAAIDKGDKSTFNQLYKAIDKVLENADSDKSLDKTAKGLIDKMAHIIWAHNNIVWWMSDTPTNIAKRINDFVEQIIKQMD